MTEEIEDAKVKMEDVREKFREVIKDHVESPVDIRKDLLTGSRELEPRLDIFWDGTKTYYIRAGNLFSKLLLLLGMTGYGKTSGLARLIEQFLTVDPVHPASLSVIDLKGDFVTLNEWLEKKGLPLAMIVGNTDDCQDENRIPEQSGDELPVMEIRAYASNLAKEVLRKRKTVIINLSMTNRNVAYIFLQAYLDTIYTTAVNYFQHKPMVIHTVIFDEAHEWLPKFCRGNKLLVDLKSSAAKIAKLGRSVGLGCVIATQRNQSVDLDVTSQSRNIILLKVNADADFNLYSVLFDEKKQIIRDLTSKMRPGDVLWFPEDGRRRPVALYDVNGKITGWTMMLRFKLRESRHPSPTPTWKDHVASSEIGKKIEEDEKKKKVEKKNVKIVDAPKVIDDVDNNSVSEVEEENDEERLEEPGEPGSDSE